MIKPSWTKYLDSTPYGEGVLVGGHDRMSSFPLQHTGQQIHETIVSEGPEPKLFCIELYVQLMALFSFDNVQKDELYVARHMSYVPVEIQFLAHSTAS